MINNKFSTKFRAFQLSSEGSLFSYYKPGRYTLIEARIPKEGIKVIASDLALHEKSSIDLLHITSWDADHCNFDELKQILNTFRPSLIEVPSYEPETNDGRLCKEIIFKYDTVHQQYVNNVHVVDKNLINNLPHASSWGTNDVLYHSTYGNQCKNDMSLIRLFRSPGFNVLSMGDCESQEIAKSLQSQSILKSEVDVLILPHHGSEQASINGNLLDAIKPAIAICSSNYDNQFDHPRESICSLLSSRQIPLLTTKRGDVIIFQRENENEATAINFITNNEQKEAAKYFTPKKSTQGKVAA